VHRAALDGQGMREDHTDPRRSGWQIQQGLEWTGGAGNLSNGVSQRCVSSGRFDGGCSRQNW